MISKQKLFYGNLCVDMEGSASELKIQVFYSLTCWALRRQNWKSVIWGEKELADNLISAE